MDEVQTKTKLWLVSAIVGFFCVIILGALGGLSWAYQDKIIPSLTIGNLEVGGKTHQEVKQILARAYEQNIQPGFTITYDKGQGTERMTVTVSTTFDIDRAVATVMSYGKQGNYLSRGLQVALSHFGQARTTVDGLTVDSGTIEQAVRSALASFEKPAQNANIKVVSLDPFVYTITSSTPGVVFDYTNVAQNIRTQWNTLQPAHAAVASQLDYPEITEDMVAGIASSTAKTFATPISLVYYDAHTKRGYTWSIKRQQIADWMQIVRDTDAQPRVSLSEDAITKFVSTTISTVIDIPPSDAIFVFNSSSTRVIKFVGSRPGVTVDVPATRKGLESVFAARLNGQTATSTPLVISLVEPQVKTEDTNTLGIKEILGTGVSNYGNSPRNRILNIRNAVLNKLNGTLVPPGVEFSLVKTLAPYTLEGGYLPELVIKGDRITPEVAGGLCQVGTTMFRSVMNSALPVTARTNHGLVVSYYNDPSNGNPGTDATIYDPWPDFKFKNDTGHYILIDASVNSKTGELAFSLWGTSDGRKGYYTPPQVVARTPAGAFETIETDTLPPGKKECQGAHPGAIATFNYIRELPGKEKETREFRSVYRAVSARCFVGHDPNKPVCAEGDMTCTPLVPSPNTASNSGTQPVTDSAPAPLAE
jgi:vancomycin resistance protein YoaR